MSTQTEAMNLALEQTLEMLIDNREYIEANERSEYLAMYDKAIAGAEKALAEQPAQQEPVGYLYEGIEYHTKGMRQFSEKQVCNLEARWWKFVGPVYTSPQPQAQPKENT